MRERRRLAAVATERGDGPGATTRLSLEVRWIVDGPTPEEMVRWAGPFEGTAEERDDRYLMGLPTTELGVKIRDGASLDTKTFQGSPGVLSMAGAGGRLEFWERRSLALDADHIPGDDAAMWRTVSKIRRRRSFRMLDGRVIERPLADAELPGCTVELTDVIMGGRAWWTFALEASGSPSEVLEEDVRRTAELFFADPVPGGVPFDLAHSESYVQWLERAADGEDVVGIRQIRTG
jgi:hypothetical protein